MWGSYSYVLRGCSSSKWCECSYNDPKLAAYLLHAQKLEKDYEVLDLQHVPHANNAVLNELSTKASMWAPVPERVSEKRLQ
jgi:hypothetical protein